MTAESGFLVIETSGVQVGKALLLSVEFELFPQICGAGQLACGRVGI